MSTLAELQAAFQRQLLTGEGGIRAAIADANGITADLRLDVYQQAYRLRLLEALGKDYPGLHALVGSATFESIGRAYIDQCPSHHPSLRWFGRHLAGFLRSEPAYAGQAAWAEVAEFEWMTGECFDAAEAPVVGIEAMAGIAADRWAGMRLRFQPAIRRLRFRWNAPAMWQAAKDGSAPPPGGPEATDVPWLMWRRDLKIYWRSLAADEDAALTAAMSGAAFGDLCERLAAQIGADAAAMRAASLLRQWLTDAMIAGLDLDD